jgi:ketosteroid isomerase-like protein
MSRENIETLKEAYDALNRGDIEAALDAFDDSAEHDWSRALGPYQGVYHGRGAVRRFWTTAFETVGGVHFEVEETIDADPHVIAMIYVRLRGRESGAEAGARGPHVWTFGEEGRAVRFRLFQAKEDALAAIGLEEWGSSRSSIPEKNGSSETPG